MSDPTKTSPTPRLAFSYPPLPVVPASALQGGAGVVDTIRYLRDFEMAHRQWVTKVENRINEVEGKIP